MSYRDETLVLRERLLVLDAEHAGLEGTAQGLRFRCVAADDDAETLKRTIRVEKAKGRARRVGYFFLAAALGLVGLALTCVLSGALLHACTNVSETVSAESAWRGETSLEGCQVEIDDAFAGSCRAKAWCGADVVWEGVGSCQAHGMGALFWSDEGVPGEHFTYVRGAVSRAVLRRADGETVVFRLPGGRGL
ncbi:MAG: hypothetical protein AB8H86_06840 [Polyangiales bacterium]